MSSEHCITWMLGYSRVANLGDAGVWDQRTLSWGAGLRAVFGRIPGLYLVDASSTCRPKSRQPRMFPGIATCPLFETNWSAIMLGDFATPTVTLICLFSSSFILLPPLGCASPLPHVPPSRFTSEPGCAPPRKHRLGLSVGFSARSSWHFPASLFISFHKYSL